jgi:hypothetical protein
MSAKAGVWLHTESVQRTTLIPGEGISVLTTRDMGEINIGALSAAFNSSTVIASTACLKGKQMRESEIKKAGEGVARATVKDRD